MTDKETRKAFEATLPDYVGLGTGDYLIVWQAAVKWATRRERERCARIAWTAHEDGKMRLRYIREMEQKP